MSKEKPSFTWFKSKDYKGKEKYWNDVLSNNKQQVNKPEPVEDDSEYIPKNQSNIKEKTKAVRKYLKKVKKEMNVVSGVLIREDNKNFKEIEEVIDANNKEYFDNSQENDEEEKKKKKPYKRDMFSYDDDETLSPMIKKQTESDRKFDPASKKRLAVQLTMYGVALLLAVIPLILAFTLPGALIAGAILGPYLIASGLLAGGLLALMNYTYFSNNRARELGKVIAFGITAATVALLLHHIETTTILSHVGAGLFPIAIIGGFSSFFSNYVLYGNDVPKLLDSIVESVVEVIDELKAGNALDRVALMAHGIVNLGILSLGLASGYMLTAAMMQSFTSVIIIHILHLGIIAPWIAVPIAIMAFIGNTAFMTRGLKKLKQYFVDAFDDKKHYKEHPDYKRTRYVNNPIANIFIFLYESLRRLAYYFLDIKVADRWYHCVGKFFLGLLKVGTLGAIAYLSQVPLVQGLISGLKWAGHMVMFSWLIPLGKAITIQSVIARVVTTLDKVGAVAKKLYNYIKGKITDEKPVENVQNGNDDSRQANDNLKKSIPGYDQLSLREKFRLNRIMNMVDYQTIAEKLLRNSIIKQKKELPSLKINIDYENINEIQPKEKNDQLDEEEYKKNITHIEDIKTLEAHHPELAKTLRGNAAMLALLEAGRHWKKRAAYHPKVIWATIKAGIGTVVDKLMPFFIAVNAADNVLLTYDTKEQDTPGSSWNYIDGLLNGVASAGINGKGFIEQKETEMKDFANFPSKAPFEFVLTKAQKETDVKLEDENPETNGDKANSSCN